MFTDLRLALRQLAKNPGFTAVAVIALALGIGANTAIFSVVNAVLLKPLPFPEPDRLAAVGSAETRPSAAGGHGLNSLSYPDFFDFRAQNKCFEELAIHADRNLALTGDREAKGIRGQRVSAGFFEVLGIKPVLGRTFQREDEGSGGGPGGFKVVISHEFWREHFHSDSAAIGRPLTLDAQPFSVIGVMPPGFQFPIQANSIDLYVSIAVDATVYTPGDKPSTEQRGSHSLVAVGRLRPGVTIEQADAELKTIAAALAKQYPESNTNFSAGALPLREDMIGDVRVALYVLFGAVACVLLIACANVGNLLLARALVRGREMAVRTALGASRGRVVRQLLTESVVLGALAGVVGLLLALVGTKALIALVPENIPRAATIELDGVVLAFTLGMSLLTGVFFGLVPALQASQANPANALRDGARGNVGGKHRLRNSLVVVEVALALVLLIGAGLLLQSFARLGQVDPGFRTERLLTARVSLPDSGYADIRKVAVFHDQLLTRIRALPGVKSASAVMPLPLSGSNMTTTFDDEANPKPEGQQPTSPVRIADTDYFQTMGIPVLRGRAPEATDTLDAKLVMVVNERFAQKFFPGQDPIGKRIKPGMSLDEKDAPMREIVGVVGNVRHRNLSSDFSPEMYIPATQFPDTFAILAIRTESPDPTSVTSAVRAELAALDRSVPLANVRPFDEYIARSLARSRFNATLLTIFAGVALSLTAIGIYGVMAYSVAQRTSEIGIRMALGAQSQSIFRLIVGEGMKLVALSLVLGLGGALALSRALGTLLYGVAAWDPLTFIALSFLLTGIAFLACWLPARRAARVNPIEALRAG